MGQDVDARTDIFAVGIILWELLTGQRLFMGDTDFQTVKKVQQAQVPAAASINPSVPADLDRILQKALTRDPNARYRTARELGQDLSKFMFKLGVPVSTYDIAAIVQSAMKERGKVKSKPQGSIIEALIEAALLEFTSLTDEEKAEAERKDKSAVKAPAPSGAFVDPTNWADEFSLGDSGSRPAMVTAPGSSGRALEAGNLSALEDDQTAGATATDELLRDTEELDEDVHGAPMPSGRVSAPGSGRAMTAQERLSMTPAPSGSGKGIAIAVVLALMVFAGAWFGHLIPH
jgi:hypothetical protein